MFGLIFGRLKMIKRTKKFLIFGASKFWIIWNWGEKYYQVFFCLKNLENFENKMKWEMDLGILKLMENIN